MRLFYRYGYPWFYIRKRADNAPPVKDHRNYGSSSIIYSKGGVVLNMVRCALGDTVFFGGLNKYLDAHQYDSVTSDMVSLYNLYQIYFLSVSNGTRKSTLTLPISNEPYYMVHIKLSPVTP